MANLACLPSIAREKEHTVQHLAEMPGTNRWEGSVCRHCAFGKDRQGEEHTKDKGELYLWTLVNDVNADSLI